MSIMPCMVACGGVSINSGEPHFVKSAENHNNENNCTDNCSPFCSCNCCSGFTIADLQITIPQRFERLLKRHYCVGLSSSIIEISLPVWHPPQLA